MSEVYLFTSGKGGVGKTTLVANIGAGLAQSGKKTVIIDMNQGLRGADIVLGVENLIVYNIFDALQKRCRLSHVLVKDPKREGLSLMPSSQVRRQQDIDPEKMSQAIAEVKKHFDYVLIDGCSGLDLGFDNSSLLYDHAIIVCTSDVLSVRAADRVKDMLKKRPDTSLRILLNRVKPELVVSGGCMSQDEIEDILGLPVLGVVTEEDDLYISSNRGETITGKEGRAGQALWRITDRILGNEVKIPTFKTNKDTKSGFWSFFRKG